MFRRNSIDHRQIAAAAVAVTGLVFAALWRIGPRNSAAAAPPRRSGITKAPKVRRIGAPSVRSSRPAAKDDTSRPSTSPMPHPGTDKLRTTFPPAELHIAHHDHVADGINNGHTIQIDYPGAETLTLGGVDYQLTQYHFHSPSEHTVDGKHFPMEMHLVHKAADDKLAVVGVFIAEGAHNKAFDPIWANLPDRKGVETHYAAVKVDVDALLPATRTSYRYDGSLTTPPCSEGVSWIVMTTPIELSSDQVAAFTRLIKDNNRPVQALNGRTILTDAVAIAADK